MRFHGTGWRERWAYPAPFGLAAVEACRLRARLGSYLYAVGDEMARVGTPTTHPMPLAYPGDRAARDADLQYMLGPDVLVAPVFECVGCRAVWVPPGQWDPLWGLAPVAGPGWVTMVVIVSGVGPGRGAGAGRGGAVNERGGSGTSACPRTSTRSVTIPVPLESGHGPVSSWCL